MVRQRQVVLHQAKDDQHPAQGLKAGEDLRVSGSLSRLADDQNIAEAVVPLRNDK